MAGSWPNENTNNIFDGRQVVNSTDKKSLFEDNFTLTVKSILKSGAIPVLFRDTPVLGGKSPKCPIKKLAFNDGLDCSMAVVKNEFMDELINKLHIEFPEIIVLDPTTAYCSKMDCDMSYQGVPLYRDDDHLNEFGAKLLGVKLLEENVNPLMTNNKY